MNYEKEFPNFELDVVIPEGFKDNSWHNDAMPSWVKGHLRLWIDYPNKEDSDFAEIPADSYHRFVVSRIDDELEWVQDIYETNDWDDMLFAIECLENSGLHK